MTKTLLVIPHYKDSARIRPFLDDLAEKLPDHFAVLVSDDGSGMEEVARLQGLIALKQTTHREGGPVFLTPLIHSLNTGKGAAVKRGWLAGGGYSLLAFADADGAVSASEIIRAERYVRDEGQAVDALFGSRVKMMGRTIKRSLHRHLIGRVFATLISRTTGLVAYDTQCGLKIITQPAFEKIHRQMLCPGFAFDVELCLLLQKSGAIVQEFPVDWTDIAGSKLRLARDSVRMAIEVFKIRSRTARQSKNKGPCTHPWARKPGGRE